MKWLRSTTGQSYTFEGKTIPSYKNTPLQVQEAVYEKMQRSKVVASLIKTGAVIVLDKYTSANTDKDTARLQTLATENARLSDQVNELKDKAGKFDELKAEAEDALAAKDKEIAELKAQLEAKSKSKKEKNEEA